MRMPDYFKAGDGPVTIFLFHGAYGSKEYWPPAAEYFVGKGYRVVAWDAPGYGLSPLSDDHSIETMARAGAHLIRSLGTDRNILVAHSLGGVIAPRTVDLAEGRVQAAVISSGANHLGAKDPNVIAEFEGRVKLLASNLSDKNHPALVSLFGPDSSGPVMELVKEVASCTRKDAFLKSIMAVTQYDATDAISKLDIPVLLTGGRYDPICTPAMIEAYLPLINKAEVHMFETAGHYSFSEVPEQFYEAVTAFLERQGLTP